MQSPLTALIQKDVSGYTYCTKLPEVQGDVCPKSNCEYPAALGYFYKKAAKAFPENLSQLVKDKLFTNTSCEQEFVHVYCQMMRGSICSTDMTLRCQSTGLYFDYYKVVSDLVLINYLVPLFKPLRN